jgi:hypothetical protein
MYVVGVGVSPMYSRRQTRVVTGGEGMSNTVAIDDDCDGWDEGAVTIERRQITFLTGRPWNNRGNTVVNCYGSVVAVMAYGETEKEPLPTCATINAEWMAGAPEMVLSLLDEVGRLRGIINELEAELHRRRME